MLSDLKLEVKKLSDPDKGKFLQRFFKTGDGQYGYGDVFAGLTVPQSRAIAKKYKALPLPDVLTLLRSKIHEERLIALLILVYKFDKGDQRDKGKIVDFYLKNAKYINNWDLVDLSADKIVGEYLSNKYFSSEGAKRLSREEKASSRLAPLARTININVLTKLAKSKNIWERRIAIISTYAFIKNGQYEETLKIAEILLHDKHDLIQKAVGWMLREVGKRCSRNILVSFLAKHYKTMPRTTLRYAIEHFPEDTRKKYLLGRIAV